MKEDYFLTVRELLDELKDCNPDSKVVLCHYVKHDYYAGYLEEVIPSLRYDSVNKRKIDDTEHPFVELNCFGVDKYGSRAKRR